MSGDSYRCDACRRRKNRCGACREARAAYRRELRERKRRDGVCIDCTDPAIDGEARCAVHQAANTAASGKAHEIARRAAGAMKRRRKAA